MSFEVGAIMLYLWPVYRKFNEAANLIVQAKEDQIKQLKSIRYKLGHQKGF